MVWNKGLVGYNYIHIDENLLRKYYLEDKLNQKDCAKKFGCSTKPIRDALIEYNLQRRNISESLKERFKDKNKHPKYGTHWSENDRDKLRNSQPFLGKNIQTNTGRTQFKKGHKSWNKDSNPNITFERKVRNFINVDLKWHKQIFERDDFTCKSCGKKGVYLHAHHICTVKQLVDNFVKLYGKDFERIKKDKSILSLDNGITLCRECHYKLHRGD